MRVNVYAEEMTDRVEIISKKIEGITYTGVRFYLELPVTVGKDTEGMPINKSGPFIHRPGDDDSSAITFWGKRGLKAVLQKALDRLENSPHREEKNYLNTPTGSKQTKTL